MPDAGVVFTGDNVFHKCKTFIQEADPWQWLDTLNRIGQLDVEVIVPGHGEPCDKRFVVAVTLVPSALVLVLGSQALALLAGV